MFYMKNITISLDEELIQYARSMASAQSKSLSRFVSDFFRSLKDSEEGRLAALESYKSRPTLFKSSGERTWTREDLYDRKILR